MPPGAVNYLTESGARLLRAQATRLRKEGKCEAAAEIEDVLSSARIVPPPDLLPEAVVFGATVTVRATDGTERRYRIVGVDEVSLEQNSVSWISPQGRALLGAARGEKVVLKPGAQPVIVLAINYER